jgi:hypothetical protein
VEQPPTLLSQHKWSSALVGDNLAPAKTDGSICRAEKVFLTPNLWGLEHITPQPMKMDFLPPELSKT